MGCLSYGGCALSVKRIIIPLLVKAGLGEVAAFVGWVKRENPKAVMGGIPFRLPYDAASKTRGA